MICLIRPPLYLALLIGLYVSFLQVYDVLAIPVSNWIDGTPYLIENSQRFLVIKDDIRYAPSAQSPQIGDQRRFYAVDFSKSGRAYFVDATCRSVGKFCYIFVEDTQWQKGIVTNTGINRIKKAFDDSTPANNAKGIYQILTENLGMPPDEIDLDPKIYILILDIPDPVNTNENFVAGYFEPMNQRRGILRDPISGMQFRSNEVEMIYLDSSPLDIESVMAREILAHEFQHLIHWKYDPDEDLWINEGCSEYASLFLCGYGSNGYSSRVEAFERNPEISLVYWKSGMSNSLANYGASYLWMLYLHEHYGGVSTISSIIANSDNGINGINAVLLSKGYSQSFKDIFSDWKVANFLDDESFESGRYSYKSLDINLQYKTNSTYPINNRSRTTQSWSPGYIGFSEGNHTADLIIDFNADKPFYNYDVKVVSIKNGKPVAIENMPIISGKGSFSIPLFGYRVDKVMVIPNWMPNSERDFGDIVSYTYSASLGDEIGINVTVVANAINGRYADIVARIDGNSEMEVPKIKITRLGKIIVDGQELQKYHSKNGQNQTYMYQVFIPSGWNGSEVKWEISYLGRPVVSGDLGSLDKR